MKEFIDLALVGGEAGRTDDQWGWYGTFKKYMAEKTILDVGTGVSKIKKRTGEAGWNCKITTHEACLELQADIYGSLDEVESSFFQTVTCFDVIEHVKDYGKLIYNIARISSEYVCITTPGAEITKCTNPYHWHEFLPAEICQLCEAAGLEFIEGWGAEWVAYPNDPKPTLSRTRDDFMNNVKLHPLGIAFSKKHLDA